MSTPIASPASQKEPIQQANDEQSTGVPVCDFVARFLWEQGVHQVFEVVGGMITHLLDALYRDGRVQLVSMHHEQGAGFAAEGAARISGVPGVAMATSGPGATNLLTTIGSCYFDSTPAVFITGQVNRHEQKGDRPIRQLGFQETDIVSMARPITKAALSIGAAEDVPGALMGAFKLAKSGRPGPVLIDLPMDVQRASIPSRSRAEESSASPSTVVDQSTVASLLEAIRAAKRPLVLAGGGIRSAEVADEFRSFSETLKVPVVHSLMGVDLLEAGHPLRVGMIGSYGNRWANHALARADFLLVLGSRLDVRQTGSDTQSFKADRPVFHVDCDPGELNNRITGCLTINSDLGAFLADAIRCAQRETWAGHDEWTREISANRERWPDTREIAADIPGINPNVFMHQLSACSGHAVAYVVDVGQHQMWAAQSLDLVRHQRFLTSGGMGAMGFALPASIGASLAAGKAPVITIAGDGAFQLNIQELQTVVRNQLPVKMVIINNRTHGMVRQFQQSYFDKRYQSTLWGYSAPSFVAIARAYGIGGMAVEDPQHVEGALRMLWESPSEPFLLEVAVDTFANAYPKLAFGRPITEMEPGAVPIEMEGT